MKDSEKMERTGIEKILRFFWEGEQRKETRLGGCRSRESLGGFAFLLFEKHWMLIPVHVSGFCWCLGPAFQECSVPGVMSSLRGSRDEFWGDQRGNHLSQSLIAGKQVNSSNLHFSLDKEQGKDEGRVIDFLVEQWGDAIITFPLVPLNFTIPQEVRIKTVTIYRNLGS